MTLWTDAGSDARRRAELWLMVGILLVGTFFRFLSPTTVPPGPSHDELRMMQLGELIVDGERPLHWKISYSAEPLYMYFLAFAMRIWGFTPFAARLVTRFAGLLLVAGTHHLIRRLFGRPTALLTSGVMAISWWPLFFSRVALRGLTLPLFFTAAVFCLWVGLDLGRRTRGHRSAHLRWGWLVTGAALVGLTWYTFTGARSTSLLLPILLLYLGALGILPQHQLWRVTVVTLVVAGLVIAPFVYEVTVHPGTAETRLDQLGGIIEALKSGNPLPFAREVANTLGVFVLTGDPNWRYNLSGRPPFGPGLGFLASLGFVVSLFRWRQPRFFLLVVWTLLGLSPAMLTPEAPSFVRGIGALPAIVVFPAVGAIALWDWSVSGIGWRVRRLAILVVVLLLALNGLDVFRDYFLTWRTQPQVHEIYQTALTEAFRDLSHSHLTGEIWVSEPFPDDRHLLLADRMLRREEIDLRWFDAERGLILPPADGSRRYLIPGFVEPDGALFSRWMGETVTLLRGDPPPGAPSYHLYQVTGGPRIERELSDIAVQSTASLDLQGDRPLSLPIHFSERAHLMGYELDDAVVNVGGEVRLVVYWRVAGPVYEPLASFAHLIDSQNGVVGQYDGFDVPPWHWKPEAIVAQIYRFRVGEAAQPGEHWLEVGLYRADTMERVPVVDDAGTSLGDRVVLPSVMVK